MSKRKGSFSSTLKAKYACFDEVSESKYKAFCTVCRCKVSMIDNGKADLERHVESDVHQALLDSENSFAFGILKMSRKTDDEVAAGEVALSYHLLKHQTTFDSLDCTTRLMRLVFEDSGRSSSADGSRITSIIADHCIGKVMESLSNLPFLSVSTVAVHLGTRRMFPVLIQFFTVEGGICSKVINSETLPENDPLNVSKLLEKSLKSVNLFDKCVAISADNCITNFGFQESLYDYFNMEIGNDLIGIACPKHVIENAVTVGFYGLEFDVETMVRKIYDHFATFRVRSEELVKFYEAVDDDCGELNRSLRPSLSRVLENYQALRCYFLADDFCPRFLRKCFAWDLSEACLRFAHSFVHMFEEKSRDFQAEQNSVLESMSVLKSLCSMLENRIKHSFLPAKVGALLLTFNKEGEESGEVERLKEQFLKCYRNSLEYLSSFTSQFVELNVFEWMALDEVPEWARVDDAIVHVIYKTGDFIDKDKCFDQYCDLKSFCEMQLRNEEFQSANSVSRWKMYFKQCATSDMYSELLTLAHYVFAIPAHNIDAEKFRAAISVDDDRLSEATAKDLLSVKYNLKDVSCSRFYEEIKGEKKFLSEIINSKKYL